MTGSTATIPPCVFVPSQGYRCVAGGGSGATGDMIVDDAGGAGTAGLVDSAPAGYTFSAADVGRYLVVSAAGAGQNGAFPIVAVGANNTVIYANPTAASGAFTGTYSVIAGLGPVPGAPDPLLDSEMIKVSITPGGLGKFMFPDTTVPVGDSFTLDAASKTKINAMPLDGVATSLDCAAGSCGAGTAAGSLVVMTTTDGVIPPGAPDYYMPDPVNKLVVARCSALGASTVDLPTSVMAQIQASGAKRVRTLFIRTGLTITGNPGMLNPTNILVGHAVAGFTTAPAVQCQLPSQCGTNTDCVTFTCNNNQCGQINTMMGVATSNQNAGDCKELVCTGTGGIEAVAKDSDIGSDGEECTKDQCNAGSQVHPPEDPGTMCSQNNGAVCDGAGACVECNVGADCTSGICTPQKTCAAATCSDMVKNGSETDVDCGGPTCPKCANTKACAQDGDCVSGDCAGTVCVGRADGSSCGMAAQCASDHCTDGVCCDATCAGTCQACTALKKGNGQDGTCGPISANTDPDNECAGADVCKGDGTCTAPVGASCVLGTECISNNCIDGVCCSSICSGLCQACSAAKKGSGADGTCGPIDVNTDPDNECAGADQCKGDGTCAAPSGTSCVLGSECLSNNCTDSVCCNVACGGLCQACSAAKKGSGSDGTCGFIAMSTDPDDECTGAETCDGAGVCAP
jgi:hypothetical protein